MVKCKQVVKLELAHILFYKRKLGHLTQNVIVKVEYPLAYIYSRVAYIYVRSRAKCLKFRTTTSKFNTLRKPLMQQKYYFIHEM